MTVDMSKDVFGFLNRNQLRFQILAIWKKCRLSVTTETHVGGVILENRKRCRAAGSLWPHLDVSVFVQSSLVVDDLGTMGANNRAILWSVDDGVLPLTMVTGRFTRKLYTRCHGFWLTEDALGETGRS